MLTCAALLLLLLGLALPAHAQTSIELDGSLPNGLTGPIAPQSPGSYEIPQTLGEARGANLFHSFGVFDIGTGDRATFTATSDFDRVIARVTGGEPSRINGTLASSVMADAATGAGADLYLLNPYGVLFGGQSSIDVPASFTVSTAHELAFANGDEVLDLLHAEAPVLSAEPPEAFGFLSGGPRAEIAFSNPLPESGTRDYAVRAPAAGQAGNTFSVLAGDVRVENNVVLRAPQGRVQLAAVGASAAEIPLDFAAPLEEFGAPATLGEVRVLAGSQLLAATANRNLSQGSVVIRGGRFTLASGPIAGVETGSVVRAGDFSGAGGPSIDIAVSRDVEIRGQGTTVRAEAPGSRPSGGVGIRADTITVSDGALVQTRADAAQPGGDLVLAAREIRLAQGGIASSLTTRQGPGGRVVLDADRIEIDGGEVQSFAGAPGPGGDLLLSGASLLIRNGILGAESSATGPGGDVLIDADTVEIEGGRAQVSTLNQITASSGPVIPGGEIRIGSAARPLAELRITDGGLVTTLAGTELPTGERVGAQPGGEIHVFADSLEVAGAGIDEQGELRPAALQSTTLSEFETGVGGSIHLELGALRVGASETSDVPGIVAAFVAERARAAGGSIELSADSALVEDGGQISTTTLGAGHAGSIDFALTGDLVARGSRAVGGLKPSGLFARGEAGSSGDAGDIRVAARRVEVLDAAEISSRADGSGNSGDIGLFAADAIRMVGGFQASSVTARGLAGRAGDVTLEAPRVELLDGGIVDVSVSGAGEAGLLHVVADELRVSGQSGTGIPSSLGAETAGDGDASGIDIAVSGLVRVEQGGELNAISRGSGAAGDIAVLAGSIEVLDGGRITVESQASARAGSVVLDAQSGRALVARGGELNAISNGSGPAGDIAVTARSIEVVDGGKVTAESRGDAAAGSVVLKAESGRALIARGGELNAISNGSGPAGDIRVTAGSIEVVDGGTVTAESKGQAPAGSVELKARSIRILDGAELKVASAKEQKQNAGTLTLDSPDIVVRDSTLRANADGSGGNIEIDTEFVLLEKAKLEAFSCGGKPNCPPDSPPVGAGVAGVQDVGALAAADETTAGGNIGIDGGAVILDQSNLNANGFGNANGGNIRISADPWLRSGDSVITASSEFGLAGVVLINTPYGEVTGQLATLPETFLDASSLLEEPCLARDAPSGSFAVERIGRVPPPPDAPLSAEPAEPAQCEAPPAP